VGGRASCANRRRRHGVRAGSDHPSAKLLPINQGQRGLILYDPKTKQTTTIDTCFTWGHVNIDEKDVLWSSFGPAGVEGWFDTRIWDKTHDEKQAQGWTAFVLDNNGNGKRDEATEPNAPADPAKDRRLNVTLYGDTPAPDGARMGQCAGSTRRVAAARARLASARDGTHRILRSAVEQSEAAAQGYAPRGMDVDSKGVVWTVLSSGHLASFDRSRCKAPLNGPMATGQHCPEGWTLYPLPGAELQERGGKRQRRDSAYYDFVDRFDMLGAGKDVPLATGNLSEGLLALIDGKIATLRVPYPMGFFAKGIDGRIDNPGAGWKGKGVYTTIATRAPFHMEGGKGETSKLLEFQQRPNPAGQVMRDVGTVVRSAFGRAWTVVAAAAFGVVPRSSAQTAATLKNPVTRPPIGRGGQADLHAPVCVVPRGQR
jgi:hypothetical protein